MGRCLFIEILIRALINGRRITRADKMLMVKIEVFFMRHYRWPPRMPEAILCILLTSWPSDDGVSHAWQVASLDFVSFAFTME